MRRVHEGRCRLCIRVQWNGVYPNETAVAPHWFLTWVRDTPVGHFQQNIDVSGGSCVWFAGLRALRSRRMAMMTPTKVGLV